MEKDTDIFIGDEAELRKKMIDNLIPVSEVMARLGCKKSVVYKHIKAGNYETYYGLVDWLSVLEYRKNMSKGGKPTHKKPPYII